MNNLEMFNEEATGSILKTTTAKVDFKLDRKENVGLKTTTWVW